jgi:hypothetical protein
VTEHSARNEPEVLGTAEGAGEAGAMPSVPSVPLVIRGEATDEEVAALVAVLQGLTASASASAASPEPAPVSAWAAPERKVRVTFPHGPGGWRASALPR